MSILNYSSPVNIGLGQVPQTVDPELFNELNDVYNAIHLINGYLDQLRIFAEGGTGSTSTPAQSMPFNRFFTAPALVAIVPGQVVSPSTTGTENGIVLGGLAHDFTSAEPESNFSQIALTSAAIGEPVQVGVGPATLEIPGALSGNLVYAFPALDIAGNKVNNGNIYLAYPGTVTITPGVTVTAMPIGVCIRDGYVMFGQFIKR